MEKKQKKRFYIGDVLVFSFKKLKENFLVLLVLYLGVTVFQMVYSKLSNHIVKSISTLDTLVMNQAIAAIPYVLLSLLISVAVLKISIKLFDQDKLSFEDLKPNFKGYWKYVAAMFLFAIFIAVIIMLLPIISRAISAGQGISSILFLVSLIVGIIYMIKLHLFGYFIVDKNQGIFESFSSSSKATQGIKGGIFGFFFVLAVPLIIYVVAAVSTVSGMPPAFIIIYLFNKLQFLIPLHVLIFITYSVVLAGGAYIYRNYADWKPESQAVENQTEEVSENKD